MNHLGNEKQGMQNVSSQQTVSKHERSWIQWWKTVKFIMEAFFNYRPTIEENINHTDCNRIFLIDLSW